MDAHNAKNVVQSLRTLAHNYNRTVIFTIHQPRSQIVEMFDHLLLLANGRVVFSGPYTKCGTYFDKAGHPCPENVNLGDYIGNIRRFANV